MKGGGTLSVEELPEAQFSMKKMRAQEIVVCSATSQLIHSFMTNALFVFALRGTLVGVGVHCDR